MSGGKDIRGAFEEVLAPDLQAIKEGLAALESRLGVSNTIGTYEQRAEERHNEVMASIRHLATKSWLFSD